MNQEKKSKIKRKIKEIKLKRKRQIPLTFQLKIQAKNEKKKEINSAFSQAKFLYNFLIFNQEKIKDANKINHVQVKVKDNFEKGEINLGSQIKQEIASRIEDNLKALKKLKEKNKVGALKPKKILNSIPLKQYGVTYKINFSKKGKDSKTWLIQSFGSPSNP